MTHLHPPQQANYFIYCMSTLQQTTQNILFALSSFSAHRNLREWNNEYFSYFKDENTEI